MLVALFSHVNLGLIKCRNFMNMAGQLNKKYILIVNNDRTISGAKVLYTITECKLLNKYFVSVYNTSLIQKVPEPVNRKNTVNRN